MNGPPANVVHLAWSKGGAGVFVVVDDDRVTVRSTIPSPPGSRLEGTLVADPPVAVKIKVFGSVRDTDGTFTLKGKLLEASRALRDRLAALATSPLPPPT